jgi:hypothetical protein
MKLSVWLEIVIGIFLWIFIWNLTEKLADKYEISDDNIIKICVVGIILIIIFIQIHGDIKLN